MLIKQSHSIQYVNNSNSEKNEKARKPLPIYESDEQAWFVLIFYHDIMSHMLYVISNSINIVVIGDVFHSCINNNNNLSADRLYSDVL